MEEHFFWMARDQAGAIFDEPDFNVARGLMMLGFYCCWTKNQAERGSLHTNNTTQHNNITTVTTNAT